MFDTNFANYDEDKNGFIEKSEMAQFIKMAFKKQEPKKGKDVNLMMQQQKEKQFAEDVRLTKVAARQAL